MSDPAERATQASWIGTRSAELDSIYDAAPVGLCLVSTDLTFLKINRKMAEINGVPAAEHIGATVGEVAPNLEPVARHLMSLVREGGRAVGPFEVVGQTRAAPDQERCWMETWAPVRNERGEIVAASVAAIEVTEQRRLELDRAAALKRAEAALRRQRAISTLSQAALGELTLNQVMDQAVEVAAETLNVPLAKILRFSNSADHLLLVAGVGWRAGLVGSALVGTEKSSQAGYTLLMGEPVVVEDLLTETRFSGPELLHNHRVRSGMSVIIAGISDRPFGVFGVHSDSRRPFDGDEVAFLVSLAAIVTNAARKEAALQQRSLLVREMAHRAGNMLQMVSTIASQTFRRAENFHEAQTVFSERLASLARANHLIASQGWAATRFRGLVESTLGAFGHKIDLEGRDVLLPPDLSFDLSLVLHELATNSVKYGAFGREQSRVKISWLLLQVGDTHAFQLMWQENAPLGEGAQRFPMGSGFGSRLMKLLLEDKWRGTISIDLEHGYVFEAEVSIGDPTLAEA